MGMFDFDSMFANGSGAANNSIQGGYDQAKGYLKPFYDGGVEDYNTYRGDVAGEGQELDQYGNPADWFYKTLGMSPTDFYNQTMQGYEESPDAKYEQEMAMRAANQGSSASGMLGSGAYFKGLQQNAADISNRDRERYYGNVRTAMNDQFGFLNNFQGQKRDYLNRMNGLAGYGMQSADRMGQYAIDAAKAQAEAEMAAAQGNNDFLGGIGNSIMDGVSGFASGGWSGAAKGVANGIFGR